MAIHGSLMHWVKAKSALIFWRFSNVNPTASQPPIPPV